MESYPEQSKALHNDLFLGAVVMQMYSVHISLQEGAETESTHAQSNDCAIQVDS